MDPAKTYARAPVVIDLATEEDSFRADVLAGLARAPKCIPSKYFYDEAGSRLFEDICRQPEYYPTRTELAILAARAREIGALLPEHAVIVEFGSGALEKVRLLLAGLQAPKACVAIDISREHLLDATTLLARDYPGLRVYAVHADFAKPLALAKVVPEGPRVGFFPGSTIGNFTPAEARAFLASAAKTLGPGGHLILGVDLKKEKAVLERAYNDDARVTARFNLNLLRRINRELAGTFALDRFSHWAFYNEAEGRVEMHLVSLAAHTVTVAGRTFALAAGETIHTENSCKYSLDEVRDLARAAGYEPCAAWTDAAGLFSVHALKVAGDG